MSTQTRNSGGGGRNQKKSNTGTTVSSENATQASAKKADVSKTEKEKVHPKPTAEQLRIAQITNSNAAEDPQMREKVVLLIEMTQRSEEDVCCALYECDNNLERAVDFLLEKLPVGAFETSSKKKKNKVASTGQEASAGGDGEWLEPNSKTDKREKSRNRSSNRGGRGGTDSRGWRGREARENEKNLREPRGDRGDDRRRDYRNDRWNNDRRGGRGGGRMGGRGSGRGERGGGYSSRQNAEDHQEVELWDNTIAQNAEKQQNQTQDDAWGDWDNEEYMGSLKDSKVFTTSNLPNQTAASVVSGTSELSAPPGLEHHLGTSVLNSSSQQGSHLVGGVNAGGGLVDDNGISTAVQPSSAAPPIMQYSAAVTSNQIPQQQPSRASPAAGSLSSSSLNTSQYNSGADTFSNAATAAANLVQQVQQQQQGQPQQIKTSATLSAEQSQYFNSLSSQNAGSVQQQQMGTYTQNTPVQYSTTYANVFGTGATGNTTGNVAGDVTQLSGNQPAHVRRTRAKLPPPSKIPSTAVEMPGDNVNNIGFLDVQFGGLDFGTEDSFDTLSDKFNSSVALDVQQQQQPQDVSNDYQNKANVQQQQQSTLAASLQSSQIGESLSSNYSQRNTTPQTQVSSVGGSNSSSVGAGSGGLDTLTKNDPYNQSNPSNNSGYQSSYQTNVNASKGANVYQQTATGPGYNSSSYTSVQSSVANTYQQQSYSSYQPNSVNSYQQPQQQGNSVQNATNSVTGSNVSNSGSSTQGIPVGGNGNNSNSNANSNTGYLSANYQSQQSAYPSSQSVYGGTGGLSNSSGFAGSTNTPSSQYSNFSTSAKLKDNSTTSNTLHFDSATSNNAVSSTGAAVSSASSSSNSASTTNVNNNSTSVNASAVTNSINTTISSSNNNGNNAVVAAAAAASVSSSNKSGASGMVPNIQMVSQYIQTGLPYYQQPVYSYEDLQMMQQRVPHVQGYYDLNYTPTSLGTGRDNLAYSMTDGRFARTDNNSSPVSNVSSSMSQQAGSSGPMLNVPYAYFYGGNVMPGGFQYGTPAIYPQQIPAANTASGGQFPKPSYSTGYGSTSYDTLSQTSQDYTKGAYPSSVNQQTKSQNVTNPPQAGTSSDITSSMYGKGHVTLNKVNSYEKQNFHSGTPPPFNMPNTQAAGGTSAQPYGMYLPMPATGHHNMIHQPIHQDSNSTGQRQQSNNQSKSASKQGYSPSYWTGQN